MSIPHRSAAPHDTTLRAAPVPALDDGGSAAPVARPQVAPVRTRRPVGYLAAAIALVLAGGLVSVFVFTTSQQTENVFVAAHTIDRGEVIQAGDLTTIAVASGQRIQGFTTSQRSQVVGKTTIVVVPRGATIAPGSVASSLPIPDGDALVGLSLKPAQLPSVPLRAGDHIVLTPVAQQNGLATSGGGSSVSTESDVDGTIVNSPSVVASSGTTIVNVYVSRSVASDLAGRAAAGAVTLYLTSGD